MTKLFRRPRAKASFQVKLSGPEGKQAAEIVDVNEYGPRLVTADGLKRRDVTHFAVLYASLTARVQWASDYEAGVTFRPTLTAHTLGLIRQGAAKAVSNRFDSRQLQEMR